MVDKKKNQKEGAKYTAESIVVLSGLEPVRKRPAMYIGDVGSRGLHHLLFEATDNAIDEAMAGFSDEIKVVIHKDNLVSVEDNGRGIPIDIHPKTKKSALETVMTTLHAGAKFGRGIYKVSGGLHGVGVSVTCALSEWLRAEVYRNGKIYFQEYCRGKPKTKVQIAGKTEKTGTKIIFQPDPLIFKEEIRFNWQTILDHLRQQAYLTKKTKITVKDEREDQEYSFYFEGGILSYLSHLNKNKTVFNEPPFYIEKKIDDSLIEIALQYVDDFSERVFPFANNIYTEEGGMHLTGFRGALTRVINDYVKKNGGLKGGFSEGLTGEDVREGLVAIISVKLSEPQFEGQTKARLGNPEMKTYVEQVLYEGLSTYFEENPSQAKKILEKCLLTAQARLAARAARETVLKKGLLEGATLPGKLADCSEKDPRKSELFIVEGESAGGSGKSARDRRFQAILPLRGKILNVERARLDRMLSSEEIKSLIVALGCGLGEQFDLGKLRYHRVIILTDADSVTGDTPILIFDKDKKEFFQTEVGEFVENCQNPSSFQVMSLNEETKKLELKDIYQVIKHPKRTNIYQIKTYCNYPIKVTSCHSLYIYQNNQILLKRGDEVKPGDFLIFPIHYPRNDKEITLDLTQTILDSQKTNIQVKINKEDINPKIPQNAWIDLSFSAWKKLRKTRISQGISRKMMSRFLKLGDGTLQQWEWKIDNVMPRYEKLKLYMNKLGLNLEDFDYKIYLPLVDWSDSYFPKSAQFFLKNHTQKIKTKFKVNEDLAYLLGWYLGDGCCSPEKKSPNRFILSLGLGKEKYLRRISWALKKVLGAKPILEKRNRGVFNLHFHSFAFKLLLKHLGLYKKRNFQKFIPDLFFNVKPSIQKALLRGLLESDGYIIVSGRKAIFGYTTASKKMAEGIVSLYRQLGIFPNFLTRNDKKGHFYQDKMIKSNSTRYDVSISTVDQLRKTKKIWQSHKNALKLSDYIKKTRRFYRKEVLSISKDFVGLKVSKVEKIKIREKYVYDFAVPFNENFVAGRGGVVLHNTDGSHIRTLLLTFFYRNYRQLIEQGHLYIGQPPLYAITKGKEKYYAYTESQKEEILKKLPKDGISIQRYKGLGEMNPEELWATTLNPEGRVLKKVTIEDAEEADQIFTMLMGEEVPPRKRFIQTHAKSVKNLDI